MERRGHPLRRKSCGRGRAGPPPRLCIASFCLSAASYGEKEKGWFHAGRLPRSTWGRKTVALHCGLRPFGYGHRGVVTYPDLFILFYFLQKRSSACLWLAVIRRNIELVRARCGPKGHGSAASGTYYYIHLPVRDSSTASWWGFHLNPPSNLKLGTGSDCRPSLLCRRVMRVPALAWCTHPLDIYIASRFLHVCLR